MSVADMSSLKQGNSLQREIFLEEHMPYIRKVVNNFCKRFCEWGRDDELSIALIAFNSAIENYSTEREVPFLPFAKVVIENRLRDYFRKEGRFRERNLSLEIYNEDQEWISPIELKQSLENFQAKTIEEERQEEIERFSAILEKYDLAFEELPEISPCHKETRLSLMKAGQTMVDNQEFMSFFKARKQLPLKELALASGVSRKTLEKGRKYIIVLLLILSSPEEFIYLNSFINFPNRKEG